MKTDIQRQNVPSKWYSDIDRKNQWGIVVLWRGMRKQEIDYQVAEVVESNHKLRIAIASEG